MPPVGRDRAQIVCVGCHARKVRCNLQEAPDRVCRNCQRHNKRCVVRTGLRSARLPEVVGPLQPAPNALEDNNLPARGDFTVQSPTGMPADGVTLPLSRMETSPQAVRLDDSSPSTVSGQGGYVGGHTLFVQDAVPAATVSNGITPHVTTWNDAIFSVTEATSLPKPLLLDALVDSYFQHVFHRYPVAERADLTASGSSTLLKQAVCMAGSLMRHSWKSQSLAFTRSLYEKSKIMLLLNHENDPAAVLGAMCLMICWSGDPPDLLSLDCPWQWTGTAIRLALQMGLHKESTYVDRPQAGRLRRIWWTLVNADRLQAACFGRPLAVRPSDCDTKLPTRADFAQVDQSSLVFISYAHLIAILGDIAEFGVSGVSASAADISRLRGALCEWIAKLPEEICLFDAAGLRKEYLQATSELHILYFVNIILLEALQMKMDEHWSTSIPSIVAASCITRLLEQVDCQEDISSVSSGATFYFLAASVPLLHHRPNSPEKEEIRNAELDILNSVLEQMSPKYAGPDVVRRNIEKIAEAVGRYQARQHGQTTMQSSSHDEQELKKLFPFPKTLCPNMELLSTNIEEQLDFAMELLPLVDDSLPLPSNEMSTYLDFFSIGGFPDSFNPTESFEFPEPIAI